MCAARKNLSVGCGLAAENSKCWRWLSGGPQYAFLRKNLSVLAEKVPKVSVLACISRHI